jgi:hypothetical protein
VWVTFAELWVTFVQRWGDCTRQKQPDVKK